jgi:flagellar biosynthesis/type III secretory pathway protein FliH
MTQSNQNNDLPKPSYSNLEIVNMVVMALTKGNADSSDPIIVKSWQALDDAWRRGRKEGYKAGYEQGYDAAKAEAMTAEEAAAAAAHHVIDGLCRTICKKARHD